MSLNFIFSPDSREVLACFLKTVARPSYGTRTTFVRVSREFSIVNSPKFHGDRFATLARTSHVRRTTVARQSCEIFWRKNRIKFLNMFKNFATSSRHMKILTTLVRHAHDCRAKVRDKIRKTVARNSYASEILATPI